MSHHLLPPARYAAADPQLTGLLVPGARRTKSWTLAIPFVMTAPELELYASEGVETVEMEAAALFAVAAARDAQAAAGRIAEDWQAAAQPLADLLDAAIAALGAS